jgi:hypothetical protein
MYSSLAMAPDVITKVTTGSEAAWTTLSMSPVIVYQQQKLKLH